MKIRAIQYRKSVPRYLLVRGLGRRMPWLYTSPLACIRLTRIEPPALPTEEWVRVRPLLSGICGSDLATITAQGSAYFSPLTSCPFVLGHEVVGEVVEVGRRAGEAKEGDRVVLEPPLSCEVRGIRQLCGPCQAGRKSLCLNVNQGALAAGIQTGYCRDTGGGWSESFVAHHTQLHTIPRGLASEKAVITEPLGCALQAVEKAPLDRAETVLILGCGSIGLLTLMAMRSTGYQGQILMVAKHPHQQKAAGQFGADEVVGTQEMEEDLAQHLSVRLYQPEFGRSVAIGGADVTFDCVGSSRSIDDALRFTKGGGSVILVGMPGIPKRVDWTAIWYKELQVQGSYTCAPGTFRKALALVASMPDQPGPIVGAEFPLAEYRAALSCALDTRRSGTFKTVFRMSEAA